MMIGLTMTEPLLHTSQLTPPAQRYYLMTYLQGPLRLVLLVSHDSKAFGTPSSQKALMSDVASVLVGVACIYCVTWKCDDNYFFQQSMILPTGRARMVLTSNDQIALPTYITYLDISLYPMYCLIIYVCYIPWHHQVRRAPPLQSY